MSVHKSKLLWQNFYRSDALPVTQPTASDSEQSSEGIAITYAYIRMHDEVFHFEIFKNFVEILKSISRPLLRNIS